MRSAGEEWTSLQELVAALSAALTVEEVAGVMVNGAHTVIGSRGGALGLGDGEIS